MINNDSIDIYNYTFPILKSEELINNDKYIEFKSKWPNFKLFQTTNAGQIHRNNIEIKKNNNNYKKINSLYKDLYNEFNSIEFRDFLKNKFNRFDLSNNEFIGDFENSELIMHISETCDGYENPWHVDNRRRIIHFLIYFGNEDIINGGEFAIASHNNLENMSEYKQYPKKDDLYNIEYFKPEDNLGFFILSQNNSYHKGCATNGIRRFIYAGYTNKKGDAWKTCNWKCNRNFQQELTNNK